MIGVWQLKTKQIINIARKRKKTFPREVGINAIAREKAFVIIIIFRINQIIIKVFRHLLTLNRVWG